MKKIKQLAIITAIFALVVPTVILAESPPESFSVRGNITIDGENAPIGTIISVEKESQNIANTTVTFEGKYLIEISAENTGKILVYKIDGFPSISKIANPEGSPSSQIINLAFITEEQDPDPTPNPPTGGGGGGGGGGGDSTPPINTLIIINNNEETTTITNVVLTLSATGANKMMIANDSDFTDSEWEIYAIEKDWDLIAGNGEKIVYAKFKDIAGNTSNAVQDLIMLSIGVNQTESSAIPQPIVKGIETDYRSIQLEKMINEAGYIWTGNAETTSANMNTERNSEAEVSGYNKYTIALINGIDGLEQSNIYAITNFIVYGTETTKILGAGERAGVLNSYKSAFGKLPTTESEWQDVIKIANGRWPNERSETAEVNAKIEFKKVYKREANMENPNDNAAVTIISYGLRSDVRNLDSEKAGILTFKYIYGYNPSSAIDWDIVRAIAYSGAVR